MPEYTTNLNLPKPLGNENVSRTNHNALVDAVDANAAPKVHTHNANEINAGTLDSARLPDASLSAKGAVQLEDSLTSTSTTKAATPSAVKAVNDAVSAHLAESAPHSATSAATANRIMMRDASGRAKVAAPSANDDIARLDSITKSQVGLGNVDNVKQMPIAGGIFTGIVIAQNNTSYTTKQTRNITLSTSDPSGGSNGDIWIKYTS